MHTALLMMAVWWVWIYTSWVTNWLDPDKAPVRLMLFVLMLAGLLLSTSLPHAFEARASWSRPPMSSCRSAAACSCCGR